jgi:hypothetical protein
VFLLGALTETHGDSELLSGFPWPIIFKPEKKNKDMHVEVIYHFAA